MKLIDISLVRVLYKGQSVGRDIQVEIKILGRSYKINKRIRVGESKEINQYLDTFESKDNTFSSELVIKVTEVDLLFSDSNYLKKSINVNTFSDGEQIFTFTIKVGENRSLWKKIFWGSREAIFEIQLRVGVRSEELTVQKYVYSGIRGDENYNRYDHLILETVSYWNNEFSKDSDPPKELLDPGLVKAIMYQESRIGYHEMGSIDVMQVGNPQDPALRTLRGELKEYWIHNGEQILLQYDASAGSVKDSINWGVRWLYHKAQGIKDDGHRYWKTWKEAVYEYGPHTESYDKDIWGIYTNGTKKEKDMTIKLWIAVLLFLPFLTLFLSSQVKAYDLKSVILNSLETQGVQEIYDIEIKQSRIQPTLFVSEIKAEDNWWETLKVGILRNGSVRWLNIENAPIEQSILSFRFLEFTESNKILLEVYGQTHMGNGNLYIYEINSEGAYPILITEAVDNYYDSIWTKENIEKYGYGTCGETYKGSKLITEYEDIHQDGVMRVNLTGITNIDCELMYEKGNLTYSELVRVAELPVKEYFTLEI